MSACGPFRPFAATPQYVRSRPDSRRSPPNVEKTISGQALMPRALAFRCGPQWPLRAMTLRNVSDPKKVRFVTRRRASASKLSTTA
jgi:hypothetical protein